MRPKPLVIENETILNEIVKRIIATAHPKKIVLFGSAARGQMTDHSDFDLLVIVKNSMPCRHTAQNIYLSLVGVGFAADIIVIHEDDAALLENQEGTIIKPALSEGRVLHAA